MSLNWSRGVFVRRLSTSCLTSPFPLAGSSWVTLISDFASVPVGCKKKKKNVLQHIELLFFVSFSSSQHSV